MGSHYKGFPQIVSWCIHKNSQKTIFSLDVKCTYLNFVCLSEQFWRSWSVPIRLVNVRNLLTWAQSRGRKALRKVIIYLDFGISIFKNPKMYHESQNIIVLFDLS